MSKAERKFATETKDSCIKERSVFRLCCTEKGTEKWSRARLIIDHFPAIIKSRPESWKIMDPLWPLRAALFEEELWNLSYICEVALDQKLMEVFCNAMPLARYEMRWENRVSVRLKGEKSDARGLFWCHTSTSRHHSNLASATTYEGRERENRARAQCAGM